MKAKIRGTEIYFDITGPHVTIKDNKLIENPVLFLLHGGPGGNHLHFKHDSIKLQESAQLVFIDQRGCGWSKKTKISDYTLENNIEDIEALRKYLGFNKINILGISYGGIVAQGYAIRYSKHIEKLILIATAPSYNFINEAKENLQKIGTAKQINVCQKFLWHGAFNNERDINTYFKIMDPLYIYSHKLRKRKHPTHKKNSDKFTNTFSHEVLNAGFKGFLHNFNFKTNLHKILCPTLILVGKQDWICSESQAKIIANKIPNSKLKILKNCGHAVTTDANGRYLKEVKQFLNSKKN